MHLAHREQGADAAYAFASIHEQGTRNSQQDRFRLLSKGVFLQGQECLAAIIADGMGGHSNGAAAAEAAAQAAEQVLLASDAKVEERLKQAIQEAHNVVSRKVSTKGAEAGTTLLVCIICGDQGFLAHVGDSRAYLLQTNGIQQLTHDHLVGTDHLGWTQEKAEQSPEGSMLSQGIGISEQVDPEILAFTFSVGARLVLASDGLHKGDASRAAQRILASPSTPGEICVRLAASVRQRTKSDNVTALVIDHGDVTALASNFIAPPRRAVLVKRQGNSLGFFLLGLSASIVVLYLLMIPRGQAPDAPEAAQLAQQVLAALEEDAIRANVSLPKDVQLVQVLPDGREVALASQAPLNLKAFTVVLENGLPLTPLVAKTVRGIAVVGIVEGKVKIYREIFGTPATPQASPQTTPPVPQPQGGGQGKPKSNGEPLDKHTAAPQTGPPAIRQDSAVPSPDGETPFTPQGRPKEEVITPKGNVPPVKGPPKQENGTIKA